jgi:polyketide biosynthesis 3-hydroxy-3-methylglutaryl-CoA synthase-like enzyme PksG
VEQSLVFPRVVGNLCSASVYLALASILENALIDAPRRVGLFSYGSGCSSEFYSGVVDQTSVAAMREMGIGEQLRDRCPLGMGDYESLLGDNLRCLLAARLSERILARVKRRGKMLVLRRIEGFHRKYEWI